MFRFWKREACQRRAFVSATRNILSRHLLRTSVSLDAEACLAGWPTACETNLSNIHQGRRGIRRLCRKKTLAASKPSRGDSTASAPNQIEGAAHGFQIAGRASLASIKARRVRPISSQCPYRALCPRSPVSRGSARLGQRICGKASCLGAVISTKPRAVE